MAALPSHVVGIDDAPFARSHRGDVLIVGAVFAGTRLDGVLSAKVRRDGVNASRRIIDMVSGSRFAPQVQAVILQGVAFAGFNVVDLPAVADALGVPAIVVSRHRPDFDAIRSALLERVPGGARKWRLIEQLGPMEPAGEVFVQRAGIDLATTRRLITRLAVNGNLPEPLRTAHLIAGGVGSGESRHRA